jgi:iron complex outermembrane recepter protein
MEFFQSTGRVSVFALAVASLCMPVAAVAQAVDGTIAGDDNSAPEIIVMARKRQENLVDVPLAVSIVASEQLERDQIYNLTDLARTTPALEISQSFGGESNGGGRVRGIGTGVFNPSVSSSVALVVDQAPVGNLAFPQLYDLSAVEVLRGPQGTLFGQGASAGVINVRTTAPSTREFAASGSVQFADKGSAGSEVGEQIYDAAINVPFSDKIALRVASQYRVETGIQRRMNATPTDRAGKDTEISDFGIRAKLLIEPSSTVRINLAAEYGKRDEDGQAFAAFTVRPAATPAGNTLAGQLTGPACGMTEFSARAEQYCESLSSAISTDVLALTGRLEIELSDALTITSVSNYRERNYRIGVRDFSRNASSVAARNERFDELADGFSQELRANYSGKGVELVFGGFYNEFSFDRVPNSQPPFVFGARNPADRIGFSLCNAGGTFCPAPATYTREVTNNRTISAFFDASFQISDQIEAFGGLRYDNFRNTTRLGVNSLTTSRNIALSDDALSGRIGLSYKPADNINLYGSYSRGYKPPAVGTDASGVLFQLDAEKSNAFELGARASLGRIQLAANVFHNSLFNFQGQVNELRGVEIISVPINYSKVVARGFELSANGNVARGLNVNLAYQFNDIRFPDNFLTEDSTAANPIDIGGQQFLLSPKHKITLSADYARPVSDRLEAFINTNIIYKSEVLYAARADPLFTFPAHAIVNTGFGVRDQNGRWNLSAYVRNLTKQREPMGYLPAAAGAGSVRAWPIAGLTARVVGLRAGFSF